MTFLQTNEVVLGDCIKVMEEMQPNSVEMTLTDIPYEVVSRSSNGLRKFDKEAADVKTFSIDDFLSGLYKVTKGSIYIFCSTEQVSEIRGLMVELGLSTRLCIWEKTNPSPANGQYLWLSGVECCIYGKKPKAVFNEHCKNTVWRFPVGRSKRHPTEKPLKLFEYLIGVSSNPGDTVFDPCLGSGTTAVAAKHLGRNYLGIEINPAYYELAKQRIGEAV